MPYSAVDLKKIRTVPLPKRLNRVSSDNFIFPSSSQILLSSDDLKEVSERILSARRNHCPVIWMQGGHVIKCGLSPIVIALLENGFIQHIASNGAAAIHDFEIALLGHTSEDVADSLKDGTFGMAEETGKLMNEAIQQGALHGMGIGESLGMLIAADDRFASHRNVSVLYHAWRLGIPYTVHVAIGTDIIHQHPSVDFGAIGWATGQDFKIFCKAVCDLEGGVFLNVGSSVIGPEVFLKAVSIARNLGNSLKIFTTANFDLINLDDYRSPITEDQVDYYYRPRKNVINRPVMLGGKGFHICGNHKETLPTLYYLLSENGEQFSVESKRIANSSVTHLGKKEREILEDAILAYPLLATIRDALADACILIQRCFKNGGTLFVAGNGGSMADAMHISGELQKAFVIKRKVPVAFAKRLSSCEEGIILAENLEQAQRVTVLGMNPVLRSAIENDFHSPHLCLAQELYADARPGDVLLSISTSGNAENLHYAAVLSKSLGVSVIGLTGSDGGKLCMDADLLLNVDAHSTAEIQNCHILIYHTLCKMLEVQFCEE